MEAFVALVSAGLSYAFVGLLGLLLLLNLPGLPANWLILALVGVWQFLHPHPGNLDVWYWGLAVGLALLGEALEMGVQIFNARRHGSTRGGTLAGMIGAFAGAILFAPLFFGLGALLGALLGAWLGCFLVEFLRGRPMQDSLDAAFGTMMGRFLGTVCKCGTGGAVVALTAQRICSARLPVPDVLPLPAPPDPAQLVLWLGQTIC